MLMVLPQGPLPSKDLRSVTVWLMLVMLLQVASIAFASQQPNSDAALVMTVMESQSSCKDQGPLS